MSKLGDLEKEHRDTLARLDEANAQLCTSPAEAESISVEIAALEAAMRRIKKKIKLEIKKRPQPKEST